MANGKQPLGVPGECSS